MDREKHPQEAAIDRMLEGPRSHAVCAALKNPVEAARSKPGAGDDVTQAIHTSLSWMAADMNYRREQTGLDGDPLSPEMILVHELLGDLAAGRIRCVKK